MQTPCTLNMYIQFTHKQNVHIVITNSYTYTKIYDVITVHVHVMVVFRKLHYKEEKEKKEYAVVPYFDTVLYHSDDHAQSQTTWNWF